MNGLGLKTAYLVTVVTRHSGNQRQTVQYVTEPMLTEAETFRRWLLVGKHPAGVTVESVAVVPAPPGAKPGPYPYPNRRRTRR